MASQDVFVTFNLPSEAATLLRQLSDNGSQGLMRLGVVSVNLGQPELDLDQTPTPDASRGPVPKDNNVLSINFKDGLSMHASTSHMLNELRSNIASMLSGV